MFAPALLHEHQAGEERVKKNTKLANDLHQGLREVMTEVLQGQAGTKRAMNEQTEARVLKVAKTAAAAAGVVAAPITPPRIELQPVTGYARLGTAKLVWPATGNGVSGLQDHWLFYKANLRHVAKPVWEHKGGAGKLHPFKQLMLELSEKSGADAAREKVMLDIMQRLLEIPKASVLCCCCVSQTLYSHFECACR